MTKSTKRKRHNNQCQCDRCDNAIYYPLDGIVNYQGKEYEIEIDNENYETLYFCKVHMRAAAEPGFYCDECACEDGPDDKYHEFTHYYPCACCENEIGSDECECGDMQVIDRHHCDYPNHKH